ncbi:VapE family protein [Paracoccus sp. MBLB3053]|uniref:VapE family protein n=1 Tax=Paracoccus aurantius TaxID=3073814 RepID=A0ABU2HTB1_9RHOB|nr:VapE domain-containing protein [Paracoccus sp. MBLB3053]MDS9467972.1 VapE family protein [Paracoccus sp. MBLB3053]
MSPVAQSKYDAVTKIASILVADYYNLGWTDSEGRQKYRYVNKPITADLITDHCNGGVPLGMFSQTQGSAYSPALVFDIDDKAGENWPQVQDAARALVAVLTGYGLSCMVFRSGGGHGIHIWVLWDEKIPSTQTLCQFGQYVVEDAGLKVGNRGIAAGHVEVLPKQHFVAPGTVGTALSLPLGRQSCWLDQNMEPCDSGDVVFNSEPLGFKADPLPKDGKEDAVEYAGIDEAALRSAAEEALTYLDADDYDTWIRMAHCLKKHWGDGGYDLWLNWSKTGQKFDGADACEKKWRSVKDADKARLRTLFKQATASGWKAPDGLFDAMWQRHLQKTPPTTKNPNGTLKSTLNNVVAMLHFHPDLMQALSRSEFDRQVYMVRDVIGKPDWPIPRQITDVDITHIQMKLSHLGVEATIDHTRRAIELVAAVNPHHPIRQYLDGLEWDGVPRLERWLTDYAQAADTPYVRAVAEKTLIGAVARIYQPGCRVDNMLTLVSKQGTKKTTFVQTLAGKKFYTDITASMDDATAHKMQGYWIIEMAEMASYTRTAYDQAKAFISRTEDNFRKPYGSVYEKYPRQCIFIATFNPTADEGFLKDKTGNRRYWVVEVGKFDIDGIEAIRDQLWAEAVHAYRSGKQWWLTDEEQEELATPVQKQHEDRNTYVESILEMICFRWQIDEHGRKVKKVPRKEPLLVVSIAEVREFLGIPETAADYVKKAIAAALREVGYEIDKGARWKNKDEVKLGAKEIGPRIRWYRIDPEKLAEHMPESDAEATPAPADVSRKPYFDDEIGF